MTVPRFSIGFGKPLWTRIGKDGTEYCISAIPLGGYVKFLDSREVEIDPSERDGDFTGKPIWQRMLIVVAGPAFNLIFTIAALWAMFVIGNPITSPSSAASTPPRRLRALRPATASTRLPAKP